MALKPPIRKVPVHTAAREETPLEELRRLLTEQEGKLRIDTNDLDGEWQDHAERYWHAAKNYGLAESYRDQAKAELSRIEAIADNEARNEVATAASVAAARDPKAKPEKATETQIKSRVVLDKQVQRAQQEYFEWVHLAKDWQSLVTSIHERRYALVNETSLFLAHYYESTGARGGEDQVKNAVADRVKRDGTI